MFGHIWRTFISAWRRAAKIDVMIDIRLVLRQQSHSHELQWMMVVEAFGKNVGIWANLKSTCHS